MSSTLSSTVFRVADDAPTISLKNNDGSGVRFQWTAAEGPHPISAPINPARPPIPGDIYFYKSPGWEGTFAGSRVWIYRDDHWDDISNLYFKNPHERPPISHPLHPTYVLNRKREHHPSYVLVDTWNGYVSKSKRTGRGQVNTSAASGSGVASQG